MTMTSQRAFFLAIGLTLVGAIGAKGSAVETPAIEYLSGLMRENDPPRTVTVSVEGGQELRLVADDAGDGITCDYADWA